MKGEFTVFEVGGDRILRTAGFAKPAIRADVFERIDPDDLRTPEDLIEMIEDCPPLRWHFVWLGQQYLNERSGPDSFVWRLVEGSAALSGVERLALRALREDPESGWAGWIEHLGPEGLPDFAAAVSWWLNAAIDWGESAHFDAVWTAQGAALAYFEGVAGTILSALGVRIIEGNRPGSSYRAAELHKPTDAANDLAAAMDLDIRFQALHQKCETEVRS